MVNIEKQIKQIISQVIEEIAEKYLNQLVEYIERYVYEPNVPTKYERTYQFLNSFTKLPKAKKIMGEILQEIYFESDKLSYRKQSSGIWQHGTEEYNYTNRMAEILNSKEMNSRYSQLGGALNIGISGLYWEEFLKYIDKNLINDLKNAFAKKGVMLK